MQEWFAIVTDKDIINDQGKVEYAKGSVVSYGSIVDQTGFADKGLRAVSIGQFDDTGPDFTKLQWDPVTEKLISI